MLITTCWELFFIIGGWQRKVLRMFCLEFSRHFFNLGLSSAQEGPGCVKLREGMISCAVFYTPFLWSYLVNLVHKVLKWDLEKFSVHSLLFVFALPPPPITSSDTGDCYQSHQKEQVLKQQRSKYDRFLLLRKFSLQTYYL